eukprot:gene4678-14878_t
MAALLSRRILYCRDFALTVLDRQEGPGQFADLSARPHGMVQASFLRLSFDIDTSAQTQARRGFDGPERGGWVSGRKQARPGEAATRRPALSTETHHTRGASLRKGSLWLPRSPQPDPPTHRMLSPQVATALAES